MVYIIVNSILLVFYLLFFIIFWNKKGIVKALLLSIIPSVMFIFSGVMIGSIPLFVCAIIFAACHIYISIKNGIKEDNGTKTKRKVGFTLGGVVITLVLIPSILVGGSTGMAMSKLEKLLAMSSEEMIEYDATGDKKISVAKYRDGGWSINTYVNDKLVGDSYDYEIGSVSKTFVGLLLAKLVRANKISLSDSISKYLDVDKDRYYPTIERLLTHTSGYKCYYFEPEMIGTKLSQKTKNDFYGISREKLLRRVNKVKLSDKDYKFEYSNFGVSVLGLVIEKIYNDNFTNIMNNFIKNELNLQHTNVAIQDGNLDKYWKWKENDGYIPAGAIISNIDDVTKYLGIYLNDIKEYAKDTHSNFKQVDGNNDLCLKLNIRLDSVGMTWIHDDVNKFSWHNGGTSAYSSYVAFSDDKKTGVVVLSNLSPTEKIQVTAIGAKIMQELKA